MCSKDACACIVVLCCVPTVFQFEFERLPGRQEIDGDWERGISRLEACKGKARCLKQALPAPAMSSETSMSSQEGASTISQCVEADTGCVEKPSTSSGSEHSEQFAERSLYCLAFVDSETGDAVRPVTDEEAQEVARALSTTENLSKAQANATSAAATPTSRQNSVSRHKPGGPCNNCGVVGECWRLLPVTRNSARQ